MKRPVSILEAIASVCVILSIVIGLYVSQINDAKQNAKEQENHELRISTLEDYIKKVDTKIDKVSDQNTQILIILQNKQDRK